ncbi:hypothetical protein LguiA_030808 [Lonicera macranthoides]
MASSHLSFLLFSLITFSLSNAAPLPPPNALHLPIRKDPRTRQYYTELQMSTNTTYVNVVLDLGGQNTWFNCDHYNSPSYRLVPCNTNLCRTLKGVGCVSCGTPRTGCGINTCPSNVYNPYRNLLYGDGYGTDKLRTLSTDGRFVLTGYDFNSYAFSCADVRLLRNLARQTVGMIGLTRSTNSLPKQLSLAFKLPNKFALCLPSSSKNGVGDIFIGGGPYVMPPVIQDLSKSLTTTPLLINPVSTAPAYTQGDPSDEYFIGVKSIRIDGKVVSFNNSLLSIDKNGNGGTKLSTIARYTLLHDSIYRAFAAAFVKAAAAKNIKRVAPVRPFGVCFSMTRANGSVPYVDLVLQSESVKWRFYEANSMLKVNNTVSCLAIQNGGLNPRTAVVIGGHQLENYLLEFDLHCARFSTAMKTEFSTMLFAEFLVESFILENDVDEIPPQAEAQPPPPPPPPDNEANEPEIPNATNEHDPLEAEAEEEYHSAHSDSEVEGEPDFSDDEFQPDAAT